MKFFNFAFLLASLAGVALSAPLHPDDEVSTPARSLEARGDTVSVPPGDDGTKLHMWLRLDTTDVAYTRPNGGTDHSGLDALMKAMGGQHKDVIVGTKSSKREYGLLINDEGWLKTHPNGDGAKTAPYAEAYKKVNAQQITYVGKLKDGVTQATVEAQLHSIMGTKTYDHTSNNCQTVANALIAWGKTNLAS